MILRQANGLMIQTLNRLPLTETEFSSVKSVIIATFI